MAVDGWENVSLGSVCKVQGGFGFKSGDFADDGIPLIRISNVSESGVSVGDNTVYLPLEFKEEYKSFLISKGDILMALSGATTGKFGRFFLDGMALLNQRVGRFKARNSLSQDYLYQYLHLLKAYILEVAYGGAQPNISPKEIEKLKIDLPPLLEQKKIAAILGSVDDAIAKTEAVIAQTERVKQGLLQTLLTRGIGHTKFKQTELGEIPENWGIMRLDEFANVKGGKRLPKGRPFSETETPYPYIRIVDMGKGTVSLDNIKYVTIEDREKIKRYNISKNDLYITIAGALLGLVGNVPYELDGALLTENAAKICDIDCDIINKSYLYLVLSSGSGQKQIALEKGVGGGVPKLALFRIKEFIVPIPSITEQLEICKVCQSVDSVLLGQNNKLESLKGLKAGLMSDLLTGHVRVNADNNQQEEAA